MIPAVIASDDFVQIRYSSCASRVPQELQFASGGFRHQVVGQSAFNESAEKLPPKFRKESVGAFTITEASWEAGKPPESE